MNTLNTIRKILLAYILLQTFSHGAFSQEKAVKTVPSGRNAEKIVTEENLRAGIEFLAGASCGGRAPSRDCRGGGGLVVRLVAAWLGGGWDECAGTRVCWRFPAVIPTPSGQETLSAAT